MKNMFCNIGGDITGSEIEWTWGRVSEIFGLFLELLIGKWCLQTEKREGMFCSFCMEFGEIVRNLYARIEFYRFFVSLRLVI